MSGAARVVCPACDGISRIPRARLKKDATCSRCGDRLFPGKPLEVDKRLLDLHLRRNDIPVLVDFWAPGCGPCRMMAGVLAKSCGQFEPRVRVLKFNIAEDSRPAQRFRVRGVPTLVLFKRGKDVARLNRAVDAKALRQWLDPKL